MTRLTLICILCLTFATSNVAAQTPEFRTDRPDQARAMLDTYCNGCHSSQVLAGGVAFDRMTLAEVGDDAEIWEAAVRKLRGRLMPPPGSRQPDQDEIDAFVAWMEASLDRSPDGPTAGMCPSSA